MIEESLNKYLEILAGHVFDNDKLVTYKWLSNELHVHVNIAKQILWEFYQKYKKDNIECTYLLIGLLKDNEMRVEVVKASALLEAKKKFSKIISEHLYSVHKPLVDLELLATSGSGNVNYSAIKCDACKERSDEEMHLLRWGTAAKKITMENNVNSKPTESINPSKVEKNSGTAKKNGFNNLFGTTGKAKTSEKDLTKKDKDSTEKDEALRKEVKDLTEKEQDSVENDKDSVQKGKDSSKNKDSTEKKKGSVNSTSKKVSPKNNSVKKGSLDNFFRGKHASSSKPTESISTEKKNDNASSSKPTESILTEKKNDNVKKEEITEKEKAKEKKENLKRGKKRNRSKETDETAKKRKRIVVQSDSSDSEIQSDIEMEESVPESPEPEDVARPKSPSPPKVKCENGKRKVLKLVNKTYKEGDYIVTKKEHVYVSCSEDEEEKKEEERRREIKKVEAKEKVKKKQSTLTAFFKKS